MNVNEIPFGFWVSHDNFSAFNAGYNHWDQKIGSLTGPIDIERPENYTFYSKIIMI